MGACFGTLIVLLIGVVGLLFILASFFLDRGRGGWKNCWVSCCCGNVFLGLAFVSLLFGAGGSWITLVLSFFLGDPDEDGSSWGGSGSHWFVDHLFGLGSSSRLDGMDLHCLALASFLETWTTSYR